MRELINAINAQPRVFEPDVIEGLVVAFSNAWAIVEAAGHAGGQILDARAAQGRSGVSNSRGHEFSGFGDRFD